MNERMNEGDDRLDRLATIVGRRPTDMRHIVRFAGSIARVSSHVPSRGSDFLPRGGGLREEAIT